MKTIHLAGLNGLRAIAAIAVVVSHITLALSSFGLNPLIFGADADGKPQGILLAGFGVSIFFALSGFLITYLLLQESEHQNINIRHFYIRRILRIWPLYYLYFAICLLVIWYFQISFEKNYTAWYVFLAANIPFIAGTGFPFLAHYWSLGVEEQFYLFYPWFFRKFKKNLLPVSLIVIVLLIILKLFFAFLDCKYSIGLPYQILHVTRFHCMLMGVMGAVLFYNKNEKFYFFTTHLITQLICWVGILLMTVNKFHFASVLDNELVSLVGVCLIMGQITKRNRIINLENRICDFLGSISYGVYVIHPLLIFFTAKITGNLLPSVWLSYVSVYVGIVSFTIVSAWFSYRFIEKRFLQIKENFSTVKSAANFPSIHIEN